MLGVLFVGLNGAVANTVITGINSSINFKENTFLPPTINTDYQEQELKSFGSIIKTEYFKDIDFIDEEEFVIGGWDLFYQNAFNIAKYHKIVPFEYYYKSKDKLEKIYPLKGLVNSWDSLEAINSEYSIKMNSLKNFKEAIDIVRKDIDNFRKLNNLKDVVVVYLALPLKILNKLDEIYNIDYPDLDKIDPDYLPSSCAYAIGSILEGCPFIDFTPNLTLSIPLIEDLSIKYNVPLTGMDGNTGQTLLKTLIAPMLKLRNFRLIGWYSTNILGNNDGKILSRNEHRELKIEDKLSVLEPILEYSDFEHVVEINYYKPRYDNKEAWDNIDFMGYLGLPMSFKINWLGRDSILAAPLVIDLIKHMEFSKRNNLKGIQEQLAIYFKHPLKSRYNNVLKELNLPIKTYKDKLVLSFFDAFYLLHSFYKKFTKYLPLIP
jgi:myo-inositol-1-phosphate synthase